MEISFSREETLKKDDVRVEDSKYYNSRLINKSKKNLIVTNLYLYN